MAKAKKQPVEQLNERNFIFESYSEAVKTAELYTDEDKKVNENTGESKGPNYKAFKIQDNTESSFVYVVATSKVRVYETLINREGRYTIARKPRKTLAPSEYVETLTEEQFEELLSAIEERKES